ncbi:MAG: hypothetical protein HQL32_02795, partial [Planctomycetes bacterium]|nr:hypothetical protein [Planctomycetota bacterium]
MKLKISLLLFLVAGYCISAEPHIAYVYPAGAQQGSTVTITLGGQFLDKVDGTILTGTGLSSE